MAGIGTVVALIKAMAPKVSPEVIKTAVSDWLDDHPEATTTVQDGSITEEKLAQNVLGIINRINVINFVAHDHLTVTGYRMTTAGRMTTATSYDSSPFIPVKEGTVIKFGMYCSNTAGAFAFFTTDTENVDADYVVVGANVNYITEGTYTAPSDGFIRFCSSKNKTGEYLYFSNIESDSDRIELETIKTKVANIEGTIESNLSSLTYSHGYIDSDGSIHAQTENKEIVSEPIYSIESLDFALTFSESKSIWVAIGAYDANGYISGSRKTFSATDTSKNGSFVCPDGTLYIRISFRTFDAEYTLSLDGHYSSVTNSENIKGLYNVIKENSIPSLIASQLKPCYDHMFVTTYGDNIVIPCQSLFHVRISKKLGFNCIETNVSTTSDGVFFVHHLEDDGTFGRYFHHVDGETDISDITAISKTWEWIAENVRYNSTIEKYRTRPVLLTEFLHECKKQGIIPFVTSSNADVVGIVSGIMGKDKFIAYRGNRTTCPTAIIYQWKSYATKQEIIDYCDNVGKPLIYGMSNFANFTDEQLADIVETLHKKGYYIATSYNDANWNRLNGMGFDFNGTQSSVNRIENGNLYNLESIFGFDDFNFTGATETDGVLTFTSAGTLEPDVENTAYPVAMIDVELWFNGSVTWTAIGEYKSNLTMTSDGSSSVFRTVPIINGSVKFNLAVASGTEIYDVKYKASVC